MNLRLLTKKEVFDHIRASAIEAVADVVHDLYAEDEDDCTWITVHGHHICVREGQSKERAIKEHFSRFNVKTFKDIQRIVNEHLKTYGKDSLQAMHHGKDFRNWRDCEYDKNEAKCVAANKSPHVRLYKQLGITADDLNTFLIRHGTFTYLSREGLRDLVKNVYHKGKLSTGIQKALAIEMAQTQANLPSKVLLYRGLKPDETPSSLGEKLRTRSATSWTTDLGTAKRFGEVSRKDKSERGSVIQVKVPREYIISSYKTSPKLFDKKGEQEYIVAFPKNVLTKYGIKASRVVLAVDATYPEDHRPAMRVPKGGSSCSSCKYLKDREKRLCGQPDFIKWNKGPQIPLPVDEYCSDWYEMKKIDAGGPGSGRHPEGYQPPANTQEATDWHKEAYEQAKKELGEKATLSEVLQRAAEIQKAGKKLEAGGTGSGCNPEAGHCGRHPTLGEQISPAKGSNPGGVFKGQDGQLRYVKFYSKQSQAAGELVANAVYTGLGLSAPKTQMFELDDKHVIATNLVEGKNLNQFPWNKNDAREIMRGFAADVLTVNWDAVGLAHDNIIVNALGVTRIDQGGTFLSRAKGGDKPTEGILGIQEVDKLFNPSINPAYAKVADMAGMKSYKDIPDFKQQVEKIVDFSNKYPGGWKGYVDNILNTMGGKDVPQGIRDKIAGILDARTKALKDLVEKKEVPATVVGKTPKGDAAFKKQVTSTVKEFAATYGADKLGMSSQDHTNSYNRKGGGYAHGKSEETPREKLFKSLGFELTQLDKLHDNMRTWTSHANDVTRNAAKEVLAGKPKSEMGRLWHVESQITQAILGTGKMKLYRGVKGPQADQLYNASKDPSGPKTLFKVLLSSANSWSDDPKVAKNFGSGKVYLRKNMPTKLILTSYKTNYIFAIAHPSEREFLCMTPEKGVSMKRSNLLNAAKQKIVIIDLRKGVNDAWLHNMRKKKKIKSAIDTSQRGQFSGSLWNDIRIIGFSGPEEEGLRAMLSRIPPELFYNIKEFISAKELGVKHGRFVPETKTIMYNPRNFAFRQRFGQGPGWVQHAEMTAIHEVGHSIYESLTPEQQKEWQDCSGWVQGYKEGNAPPYTEVRPGWPYMKSNWTHRAGAKFTRHYAEKNPNEDFADSFSFFLLGKGFQMEPAKRTFLENFIKDKVKWYPSASVESPVAAYPKQEAIRKAASV